jgi:glucose-6-phosphate 1-dehydrogenase
VQITVAETVGVEERGKFYEQTGALRDMVPYCTESEKSN